MQDLYAPHLTGADNFEAFLRRKASKNGGKITITEGELDRTGYLRIYRVFMDGRELGVYKTFADLPGSHFTREYVGNIPGGGEEPVDVIYSTRENGKRMDSHTEIPFP